MMLLLRAKLVINFVLILYECWILNNHIISSQRIWFSFNCQNPNQIMGQCISIYDCESLLQIIEKVNLNKLEIQFLRESQCENGLGRSPFVCCTSENQYTKESNSTMNPITQIIKPDENVIVTTIRTSRENNRTSINNRANTLPEPPNCGPESLADKIYNGNNTALDQYPWMVLLEYINAKGEIAINCGGSLINDRYILTAAHCVKGETERVMGTPKKVRLGEYDIISEIDCINSDCNDKVLRVNIESIIPHFGYVSNNPHRHHDIALIRLEKDIIFTYFIQPVCLPLNPNLSNINIGENLIVAGWGRTLLARNSRVKQQLAVPLNDHNSCVSKFQRRNINILSSQLCAGGEFAKDSCDGDSGGPLIRKNENRWYLEGIVSFGNRCGLEGWPGVYTRVRNYTDWIRENIKA